VVNQVVTSELGATRDEMFIGRYRQIRRLSGGASGDVYLVEDASKRSRFALKLLPKQVKPHRLRGEFARLTELSHPNIVRVIDAGVLTSGEFAERAFLVMDYIAGQTLAESIASGLETHSGLLSFPNPRFGHFAQAAEALADALAYLHGQGVVHGDISPANIRCDESGRPILIDFGLAQHLTGELAASAVSGTLGFIAPEALLGERGPTGDLFALGATLYDAWTGTPPFGLGMEAVKRIWQGQPPPPSSLHPGLSPAWDQLLLGLIAADVEDRPSSAREALRSIRRELPGNTASVASDLGVPFPAGDPLAGVVVGRSEEQSALRRHLEQLAEGAATASVVCIAGAPGSGRHTLIKRALREARLAILSQTVESFAIEESEYTVLWGETSRKDTDSLPLQEPGSKAQANLARVAGELDVRAQIRPLCLALAGSPEDEALARAIAGGSPSGRLLILLPCERAIDCRGSICISPSPLSRVAIAELARRGAGCEAPPEILDEIVTVSAGLAGASALLVRNWIARLRGGGPQLGALAEGDLEMARLLDSSFAALTKPVRTRLLAIALSAETGEASESEDAGEAEAEAREAGWVLADGEHLPSELHLSAVFRALANDHYLQKVGRKLVDSLPDADARKAEVQLAIGERRKAAAEFWLAMRGALAQSSWSKVAAYGLRAREADSAGGTHEERIELATALGILGRYHEALAVLDGGEIPGDPTGLAKLAERKAWLLGRLGDPEAARGILETALLGLPRDGEGASLLRARLARMLVASGRFEAAIAAAEPAFGAGSGIGMAARESTVLALAYSGRLEAARRLLDTLSSDAREAKDRSLSARVVALDGLVQQLVGQPAQAAMAYEQAVREYDQIQDLHGSAAAAFNLGCVLAETGDYARSIEALERAIRELGRLGAVTDHALAVFNVGQLFLELGDVDAAARAVESLQEDARTSHVEAYRGHALLLTAQVQRKRGVLRDALGSYHEAAGIYSRLGMQALRNLADIERAEILAQQGEIAKAQAILAQAEQCEQGAPPEAPDSAELPRAELLACARARIALCDPASTGGAAIALAETLAKLAANARNRGRLPMAWRLASLAGQLFARTSDAREQQVLDIARTCFGEVKMKTPTKYWPGLESDSEAKVIELRTGEVKSAAGLVERAAILEGRLRRLLRINKRLNSDLRLSRVLETIIDTVIELTDAERGFLLLKDSDGELVVKVARNMDQTTLDGTGSSLSRSIAKQAADSGQPVVAVDAAGDSRFSELLSVNDLHLRSVLAVPLAVKGQIVGTIYVDHRLRKGVFGDDELAMVLDFADQGAIAIENARVVSELRRREQQVQSLNRRLERELKVQEAALSDARVELKESRQAAALRYDYRQIVGQSPCMLDLFRVLDRVTDTSLPVVIEGESGTGKELVARAIHFHGSRKERAFVSENCAAIPETLLESALFGHVRGAFTGAERETRGLFAIANGGTLFLDEVAEMSPAMQGKLLRVLQDGEFHRVGGERAEKVDVRVLVATNKNLTDMVETGKFRKDLFYRLSVVRLHLPPLRERREDIPLLLRHFLEKAAQQAGANVKTIDPAALAKLCRYGWPGNVRELENEIARAGAFAGAVVGISDLSDHIQTGQDANETIRNEPDSLRLRHRVERLERQLIREAMSRSQGNQTKASTLLGLSRFGLQKKLRRYNLGT
jgi:transcriptional regulator with GAF, ATPase, and Fis domain/tetratricopeptide (TPR) repeat protein/tRNA A-37 threonylcarbamoyl transferase component Bud32